MQGSILSLYNVVIDIQTADFPVKSMAALFRYPLPSQNILMLISTYVSTRGAFHFFWDCIKVAELKFAFSISTEFCQV